LHTHNASGLLLCWDFIVVSRQPKLFKKLMMKLTTNIKKNFVCPLLADSISKADCFFVRQHSSKSNVGCRISGLVKQATVLTSVYVY
jgi:hypothetical protein